MRDDEFVVFASGSQDAFNIGFPAISVFMDGDDAVVTIPHFEGEISLDRNDLVRSSGLGITYQMGAELGLGHVSLSGLAGIGDPFSLSSAGSPTDGVEFFLDGLPLSSYPIVIVPEPCGSLLIAMGSLMLLVCCRV